MKQKIRKYSLRLAKEQDRSPIDSGVVNTVKIYAITLDDRELSFSFLETHSTPIKYSFHDLSGKPLAIKQLFDLYPRMAKDLESASKNPEQTLRDNGFTSWKE